MIYLDNSATTPIDPEVLEAMLPYLKEEFGNPSSRHYTLAVNAEKAVEKAREQVAALINAKPNEIIFTSGASESNNFIIKGVADYMKYYEEKGYNVLLVQLNDNNDYKKIIDLSNKIVQKINQKRIDNGMKVKEIKAVVVGAPNVGKSTLINHLAGKKVAKTGNMPGVTKSNVWLKTKYKILILDTPGILWPKFDEEKVAFNLCAFSAIKEEVIPHQDIAYYILNTLSVRYPNILKERFKIEELNEESFDIIGKNIGASKNDEIDYKRVYKYIINEIKSEHIKGITFDYE